MGDSGGPLYINTQKNPDTGEITGQTLAGLMKKKHVLKKSRPWAHDNFLQLGERKKSPLLTRAQKKSKLFFKSYSVKIM